MAGPYDYSINIPQPPAQNFLQSLLGIQQLKGLQQQSQLAEQQAAIQQQQAAFQQQMQPLEMAKAQAAIDAARANAAQSGASTNLLGIQASAAKSALEETQRKNQAVAAYQNEALKLAEDPTSWNATDLKKVAMKAAVLDPQSFSGLKNLFSELPQAGNILSNAASEVVLSVNAGKPDVALNSINKYLAASQAALEKNPNDKSASAAVTFLEGAKTAVENDPAGAALSASNFLFNTDPNKFDATTKALKAAGEISETQAKTKTELAKAFETKQQKQVDEEKRALDLEKERLQIEEIKQKLEQSRSEKVKVFASTNKYAKELSDAAATNTQNASLANDILAKIDSGEVKIPSTFKGAAWQYVKDRIPLLGNDITMLRTEYQKLANSEVIKSLPPGSASDADRKFAQDGVMSKNASPEQFRKGVEAMARLSEYASRYNEAKLAWVSENNGSAGNSMKEFQIFGSPIKKGTAFHAWFNKVGNTLDQNAIAPASGADLDALLNKYR